MALQDRADTVRFAGSVGPGNSETERYLVERPSRIDEVRIRIYRGAELALQVVPFAEFGTDKDRRRRSNVVRFAGDKQYVDGDDDAWEFPVRIPIDDDEVVGVEIENTDGQYTYDYSVDFHLTRTDGGGQ
jgi:hypothetical protein